MMQAILGPLSTEFEVHQLQETLRIAEQVGGVNHNFKIVQVPFNKE